MISSTLYLNETLPVTTFAMSMGVFLLLAAAMKWQRQCKLKYSLFGDAAFIETQKNIFEFYYREVAFKRKTSFGMFLIQSLLSMLSVGVCFYYQ